MNGPRRKLILFARYPAPGRVKTRLIPALGAEGAAALHRRLVLRTLRIASLACRQVGAELEIQFTGSNGTAFSHWLGDGFRYRAQSEGDLGQRMATAFGDSFREDASATVLIGSDCPTLTIDTLTAAFEALSKKAAVLGPATDGGYYLVGLTRLIPDLFNGIPWGTEHVLGKSLHALEQAGVQPHLLEPLSDLDRAEDLPLWQQILQTEEADLGRISVIIPTLDEVGQIAATLELVRSGKPREILVADGGSTDETACIASQAGVSVLTSSPGRARQMNGGAARATGNVLLFLHADTHLPANWANVITETLADPRVAAGAFRFRIAGDFPGRRFIEWTTQLRSTWFQCPYGDQGLFLRRSVFEELGGFADLPIMEDYELVARLRRRGRVVTVTAPAFTSGRRWKKLGFVRVTLINKLVVAGYRLGISTNKLSRLYRGETNRSGR